MIDWLISTITNWTENWFTACDSRTAFNAWKFYEFPIEILWISYQIVQQDDLWYIIYIFFCVQCFYIDSILFWKTIAAAYGTRVEEVDGKIVKLNIWVYIGNLFQTIISAKRLYVQVCPSRKRKTLRGISKSNLVCYIIHTK